MNALLHTTDFLMQTSFTVFKLVQWLLPTTTLFNYLYMVHTNSIKRDSLRFNLNLNLKKVKWNLKKVKWKEIETELLRTNWSQDINNFNVNERLRFLYEDLIRVCRKLFFFRKNLIPQDSQILMCNQINKTTKKTTTTKLSQ